MPGRVPADIPAVRTAAALAICLVFVGTAAATPRAKPAPLALVRVASKLSGLPVKRPVPVVSLTAAQMQARARAIRARDYPPARQGHDEAVYRALGLLQPGERLAPTIVARAGNVAAAYAPVATRLYARRCVRRLHVLR